MSVSQAGENIPKRCNVTVRDSKYDPLKEIHQAGLINLTEVKEPYISVRKMKITVLSVQQCL